MRSLLIAVVTLTVGFGSAVAAPISRAKSVGSSEHVFFVSVSRAGQSSGLASAHLYRGVRGEYAYDALPVGGIRRERSTSAEAVAAQALGPSIKNASFWLRVTPGGRVTTPPELIATKPGAGAADDLAGLTASERKAVDSLGQRSAEHQVKLDAYRANPDAFDNQGFLKNAPSDAVRQRIIDGRIRHLEQEIKTFQDQIRKIMGGKK